MPLLTCKLCGKIFSSSGGRTCPACHKRLDDLYPRVREYLRDSPKSGFNVEMVADDLDVDIRDIQGLLDLGYLDRDVDAQSNSEALRKQKLAQELENSLKQMKTSTQGNKPVSYGQQRYGDKKR